VYRKRDGARRLHEHGVLARFRYNDLKEAARAVDAGPMQIQWWEGAWPSCARLCRRVRQVTVGARKLAECEKGS